jgi:hypothetical protein
MWPALLILISGVNIVGDGIRKLKTDRLNKNTHQNKIENKGPQKCRKKYNIINPLTKGDLFSVH